MEKVFIDTDIILDVLAKREPHFEFAAHLLSLSDKGKIKLGVSSLTFSNLITFCLNNLVQQRPEKY